MSNDINTDIPAPDTSDPAIADYRDEQFAEDVFGTDWSEAEQQRIDRKRVQMWANTPSVD
jgi:hypothetical protein